MFDAPEKFNSILFSIQDGFMDMEEVHKWILPSDYDHTEAEAKHLVMTCQFLKAKVSVGRIGRSKCYFRSGAN